MERLVGLANCWNARSNGPKIVEGLAGTVCQRRITTSVLSPIAKFRADGLSWYPTLKQRRRNATPSNEELFVGAPTTGTHRRAWMSGNKSKNDRRFLRTLRVLRNDTAWGRLWDPADPASGAGIGYERYPMSQNRHPSAFAQGRLFTITLQWVGMGRSWRIIQLIPNRSCTCPKREAKNVSWMGMRMRPPCDSAEKTRSASLSLSTLNVR